MQTISLERKGNVAVVTLNRGVTNPISLALLEELGEAIRDAGGDSGVQGLLLGSNNDKFFSIGFDIPNLYDLDRDDFALFYRTFNKTSLELFSLPKPVVAALSGHAIAGGCILALCCDYRVIAEGRKLMGLNEIKLGVPVPYLADCVLRDLIGLRYAREILDKGEFYPPQETLKMGMVDEVVPEEHVFEKAMAKAEQLASLPSAAFAMIKENRVEEIRKQVLLRGEEKAERFLDLWYTPDTRLRLKVAMETFSK